MRTRSSGSEGICPRSHSLPGKPAAETRAPISLYSPHLHVVNLQDVLLSQEAGGSSPGPLTASPCFFFRFSFPSSLSLSLFPSSPLASPLSKQNECPQKDGAVWDGFLAERRRSELHLETRRSGCARLTSAEPMRKPWSWKSLWKSLPFGGCNIWVFPMRQLH